MENAFRFAVIGLSALEGVAMRRMIADDIGVRCDFFHRFSDFESCAERYDAFVADSEVILFNLDFFMPRKQRVASVSSGHVDGDTPFSIISRGSDEQEMVAALRSLAKAGRGEASVQGELSSRELDVLREVAAGKTNKEIADALCISVNTVITHRRNLSVKLGIRSASGLSLYALMNGLI